MLSAQAKLVVVVVVVVYPVAMVRAAMLRHASSGSVSPHPLLHGYCQRTRYVVAAKNPDNGTVEQVFTLNETAANMLRLFSEGLDAEAVAQSIASDYEAPVDMVRRDVAAFWEVIAGKGLT